MKLCFGTYASIMKCCSQLAQDKLVPRIIWVVDEKNSALGVGVTEAVSSDELDGMEGNKTVVSKLLSCNQALKLKNRHLPSIEIACERFKSKVMPCLIPDKIGEAVLAILYIISNDETIEVENIESFRKCLGMYPDELLVQTTFDPPDFFARVLLYTTYVDNKDGLSCAKEITDDFIEKAANNSWARWEWNDSMQTLKIIPEEEYRLWGEVNKIAEMKFCLVRSQEDFRISPVDYLLWGKDADTLFPDTYRRIECYDPRTKKMMLNKVKRYTNLLHELAECLRSMSRPAANQTTEWPIFPNDRTRDVRQRLSDVCNELYTISLSPESFSPEKEEVSPEGE